MAIRFKQIQIKNFKIFTDFKCDFEQSDLLMFDGPNGFGKTSFYDAIELLITGNIKRYQRLSHLIDRRLVYLEKPFLNVNNPKGDIVIKAEILVDDVVYILCRKGKNIDLPNSTEFSQFRLYELNDFADEDGELIILEKDYLERLFGNDYRENFEFLNYIEQEDNAFLLKNNEKDKKQAISHLFNVQEFELKIDKYEALKRKVGELCNPDAFKSLNDLLTKLDNHKKSLKETTEIKYNPLFIGSDILWDQENIKFSDGLYNNWFGERGELLLFRELIKAKESFLNFRHNKRIIDVIEYPQNIDEFLHYGKFISNQQLFKQAKKIADLFDSLLESFEEITTFNIVDEDFDLDDEVISILNALDSGIVTHYIIGLENIRNTRTKASALSKLLSDLQSSRNLLIERFKLHQNHLTEKDTECPLCGHDWATNDPTLNDEILMQAIDNQTIEIKRLADEGNDELGRALSNFKENIVGALEQLLEKYLEANPIDVDFIETLVGLDLAKFKRRTEILEGLNIEFIEYLNDSPKKEVTLKTPFLIDRLRENLKQVDLDIDYKDLNEIYNRYFKSDENLFEKLETADVNNKIQYIDWQYAVYQNSEIRKLQSDYDLKKIEYDAAVLLNTQLKDIIDTYKKSLNNYNRTLIRDIEILFHIYSGRIVQDFQGGLGLFIKEDKGIKFLTDPTKTFDAVFSMSSGQLAALIISFTLALNKKYSKNKILFIDDPIQSMDDLNVAGFIEVLRNDFSDRQIFISTHEDMMSSFMRYKFERFGIKTKRINMKGVLQ